MSSTRPLGYRLLTPRRWAWEAPEANHGAGDSVLPHQPTVWLAALVHDARCLAPLAATLSAHEQARGSKLRRVEDRHRFVIGRGLVRTIGSALTKIPADRLAIAEGAQGKPYFADLPAAGLYFNVTHAGAWIAVAFSATNEVGIDLEEQREGAEWDAILAKIATPLEHQRWRSLEPPDRSAAFFRVWTRHEAELKALGLGLGGAEIPGPRSLKGYELALPAGYFGWVAEWERFGLKPAP